jgi:DNA transformation protein and related proteins
MANSRDFLDHLSETVRAMFGGHGVYVDGLFVALVDDDVLYLRADDGNRAEFSALDLSPFEYTTKDGSRHGMSYHRAPDDALESAHAMAPWVRSALGAALRAAAARDAPKAKRTAGRAAKPVSRTSGSATRKR